MSRSSRKKETVENHTEFSEDKSNEGTSARTRPFSIDEIMLRRKNKKQHGDVKEDAGGAGNALDEQIVEKNSYRYRHNNSIISNKKHTSEDFVKLTSRMKNDDTYLKESKLVKDKNKENHDFGTRTKATQSKHISNEAKGHEIDQQFHGKRKHDESINASEYKSEKRHVKDLVGKDRHAGRSEGKSEKESKMEHQNKNAERTKERNVGRKHDSRRLHGSEFSERKERRESTQFHHEESRSKRRWSRSRERDKDKGRRSLSVSPRAHKHSCYDVWEHGDLSSHPSKDKSGRSDPDVFRKRISSNVSNSHYRRHGGSDSGLGGYSPRKRKTEAAVKTPPPINRSPEKRSAGWDLPPAGADNKLNGSVLSMQSSKQIVLSSTDEFSTMVPVTSFMEKPVFGSFPNALFLKMNASVDSVQLTQATRPMRRLYIENLPASASEKAIMEWINNGLLSSGVNYIQGTQPCISCIIHNEKAQALVEFLTPEDASAALSFDGSSFFGCVLKIRRPKDFVGVTTGAPERTEAAVNQISDSAKDSAVESVTDVVEDSPHKIFIGGIAKIISSKMLMEIAGAFGNLKAYHFELNADLKEPCAFLEYIDQSVTHKACAGLNGMRLGGQVLTVVQATPDASAVENTGNSPFYGIPEHAKPLLVKPTQVLKLKNVLNLEALSSLSEPDLEEILEDIRLECARFGTVKSVNVVKEGKSSATRETVSDNTAAAGDKQGLNSDDKSRMEELGDGMGAEFDKDDISEPSNNIKQPGEDDNEVAVSNGGCDNKFGEAASRVEEPEEINTATEDNSIGDEEVGKGEPSSDTNKPEEVNGTDEANCISDSIQTDTKAVIYEQTSNDRDASLEDSGGKVVDTTRPGLPEIENKQFLGEQKSDEASRKLYVASELDFGVKIESDAFKEGKNKGPVYDMRDVFEPGCVLVEYRRIEASCMAAHCLHGRLFDDRIVTVDYVAYDVYRARFPK